MRQRCLPCIYTHLHLVLKKTPDIESFNSIRSLKVYGQPSNVNPRGLRPIVVAMLWSGPRAASPYVLSNVPLDSSPAWPYISLAATDRTKLGLPADFVRLCVCVFSTVAGFPLSIYHSPYQFLEVTNGSNTTRNIRSSGPNQCASSFQSWIP